MSAHKKLMEARLSLQATVLKKSGQNKFAGYAYFELGDFIPAVNTIFGNLGLCGVVSYGTELATLTITDIDDGSSIAITSPMSSAALKGCHEVQNLGAVETYIRRYLWVTAMELVEHDALDASSGEGEPKPKPTLVKPDPVEAKLNLAAKKGTAELKKAWESLPADDRKTAEAQVVRDTPKEIPALDDATFRAYAEKHRAKIADGSKSPNDFIAWLESKGALMTEDQKAEVASWVMSPETIEGELAYDPFVKDMEQAEGAQA